MNTKLMIISAVTASALLFAGPAFATTQSDLKSCRTALAEQGHFDADQHRLKFSHRKGNSRKRTVFMTLKSRSDASKSEVACVLQRKDVIDLAVTPTP